MGQQRLAVVSAELESVKEQLKQATINAEAERLRRFEIEKTQLQSKNDQDRIKDVARIGFSIMIIPFALFILVNKTSTNGQRTVAGSALAALLGFWFAK